MPCDGAPRDSVHGLATTTRGLPARSRLTLPVSSGLSPAPLQDLGHGVAWAGADLDEKPALLGQGLAGAGGDAPIGVEPVRAAIEREARIVGGHLRRQPRDLARGEVRRVGEDQVEPAVDRVEPIGGDEGRAGRHAVGARIGGGDGKRSGLRSVPTPSRARQLGEQGDEDAAGAGAEIEQA